MSVIVIDAAAGVEIVADTRRGRALARLIPPDSQGWVPEHFYADVLAMLRRQFLVEAKITEPQASAAVSRLSAWRLHRASVAPRVPAAWRYRHNMTAADALYVALAESPGGDLLSDGHQLVQAPTFPEVLARVNAVTPCAPVQLLLPPRGSRGSVLRQRTPGLSCEVGAVRLRRRPAARCKRPLWRYPPPSMPAFPLQWR